MHICLTHCLQFRLEKLAKSQGYSCLETGNPVSSTEQLCSRTNIVREMSDIRVDNEQS